MTKVKIFSRIDVCGLEEEINNFLNLKTVKCVKDIKYQVTKGNSLSHYSALVIYEEMPNE